MEISLFQWFMLNWFQPALTAILVMIPAAVFMLHPFYKKFQAYRLLSQIPGPSAVFNILYIIRLAWKGTIHIESLESLHASSRAFSKFGIFRIWIGHLPMVFVFTPELAEIVLTAEKSLDRPPEVRLLYPIAVGNNNLITVSPAQEWRKRRRLLNPAFHVRIIERYLSVFNEHASIFVEKMQQRDPTHPLNLLPDMQKFTMDIICATAMGADIENQKRNTAEFIYTFNMTKKLAFQRLLRPWLHPDIFFNCSSIGRLLKKNLDIFNQMGNKIIAQKKARMISDPAIKKLIEENFVDSAKQMKLAFIDLLLYQHLYGDERLPEEDILGEVNTFIFAGFETCSLTLSWALYLIGNDLRVQQAIQDELDMVLDNDRLRPISEADIKNMKYLSCVFKETLRLYPPGSVIFRVASKELKLKQYTVPEGTALVVFVPGIHGDPRYFSKPDSFIPERFLDNNEDRHPFAYIPYSAGPRNCIGQRFARFVAITLLAHVLRKFSVKSANTRDKVRIGLDPMVTPIDPLHVYLTPRWP